MKISMFMSLRFNKKNYYLLLAPLWFISSQIHAIDVTSDFHISPFINQSAVHTSNNNFLGQSDDSTSFDSSEIGVVLNYKATEALNFSGQIISRKAGGKDNGKVEADYYFLNYSLLHTVNYTAAIKAGKLRLPYGLYNDTRDVAGTNPGIILPQSIYVDRGRDTFFSGYGIMLHGENFWQSSSMAWDIGSARIEPDNNEMGDLAGFPTENNAKGTYNPMARLFFSFDNDTYKIGLSYRKAKFEFIPVLNGFVIPSGTLESRGKLLSLQYNQQAWSVTAEWGRSDTSADFTLAQMFVNPPGIWVPLNTPASFKFPAESYYLQGEYRLNPKITLLVRRDEFYTNRNDRYGKDFTASINSMVAALPQLAPLARPAYSQYAIDNTIGVTWNMSPDMLTRIEWHNVEGTAWLSATDNPNSFNTSKYWNMVAVQFAYRF